MEQRSKKGVVNVYEFNTAALQDSIFFLNIFPGETIKAIKQKVVKRGENNFTWHGYIQGPDKSQGSIALVYLNGEISGNLNYKAGNYSINPMGKGVFSVYEIDFKRAPYIEDAPGMTDSHKKTDNAAAATPSSIAQASCNLRVLVAFTSIAESFIKDYLGYSSLTQFALQAIAESNQAYLNSGVGVYMELAASVRVNYTESGDDATDLNRFMGTSDGYMDQIHTYRDIYAADVNVLISNNSQYCGLATTVLADAGNAFCVVNYDCALGNYSFAHEIGHLQGCRHNPEVDNSISPFAYGHGYVYTPDGWRTIMAINFNGETRLQYFSNPNVTYNGVPMGTTTTHYNARVLNETTGTVNNFRTVSSSVTINSDGAVINDEASDAVATTEVVLQDGFQASDNSEFTARLINCVGPSIVADNTAVVNTDESNVADSRSALAVYPTVTRGPVYISTDNSNLKNTEILVSDNSGRIVAKSVNNAGKKSITMNLSHLPNGLYIIQVKQAGKSITRKVIVQK
ncbi:zinc-dependent metalloprotease [Niastella koreensis]|uniref:zinc-dependent metalloprotease n=1 Tax=Niastella koreensis TaxID=354356 RepID=UPI001A994F24|nr:zinc-dependent metalloprotease [Niastella koreensis]